MSHLRQNNNLLNIQAGEVALARRLKFSLDMEGNAPSQPLELNGIQRAGPMKARRGKASVGLSAGFRMVPHDSLPHPKEHHRHGRSPKHNRHNQPQTQKSQSRNPPKRPSPVDSRDVTPEPGSARSIEEEAQSVLHQFLAHGSLGKKSKSTDDSASSSGEESKSRERGADGRFKSKISRGDDDSASDSARSRSVSRKRTADGRFKSEDKIQCSKQSQTVSPNHPLKQDIAKDKPQRLKDAEACLPDVPSLPEPTQLQDDKVNLHHGNTGDSASLSQDDTGLFVNSNHTSKPAVSTLDSSVDRTQRDEATPTPVLPSSVDESSTSFSQIVNYSAEKRPLQPKNTQSLLRHTAATQRNPRTFQMPSSESSFEASDTALEQTTIRRSRRINAAPKNYYAPPPGFFHRSKISYAYDFENDDSDNLEVQAVDDQVDLDVTRPSDYQVPHSPLIRAPAPQIRVVHRSEEFRVQQESFTMSVSELVEEDAPYHRRAQRAQCGELCAELDLHDGDADGVVVHVDFDQAEMEAVYFILAGQPFSQNDMAIQDQLTQAVRHSRKSLKTLASHINRMSIVYNLLSPSISQLEVALLAHRDGNFAFFVPIESNGKLMKNVIKHIKEIFSISNPAGQSGLTRLQKILRDLSVEDISRFAAQLPYASKLALRGKSHIRKFLEDAQDGLLSSSPSVLRALSSDIALSGSANTSTLLRDRELGYNIHRRRVNVQRELREHSVKGIQTQRSWKGASNDIVVASWSPDGTRFAAGATTHCDELNMQYNRNNNLLFGNLTSNTIHELPDHRILRPLLSSGPNSQQSTYNTTDPNLYQSVTAIQWPTTDRLLTASYDKTVKVWDAPSNRKPQCIKTLAHPGKVDVMAVSPQTTVLATGCDTAPFFRLWWDDDYMNSSVLPVTKSRSAAKLSEMVPTCISWGTGPACDFITGGLSANEEDPYEPAKEGYLGVWQITEAGPVELLYSPNSQNVFDITWHPTNPFFATGSSAPLQARTQGLSRDTRSVVRTYDPLYSRMKIREFECPALDINTVTICPTDPNYLTASCTDGATYVWDSRRGDRVLLKLPHGDPIGELDAFQPREQADVGVRLALWNRDVNHLFTGGSDGMLKEWDILRAQEDVLIRNVVSFEQEIMSGAFSPDETNLLIGDACGAVYVLSTAPFSHEGSETMQYEGASEATEPQGDGEEESGVEIGNHLISSGQLVRHPEFGVGQGPNYTGPYAAWARPPDTPEDVISITSLIPEVQALQLAGPPPLERYRLDAKERKHLDVNIQLAIIRNKRHGEHKRKRRTLVSRTRSSVSATPTRTKCQPVISLLSDDDEEGPVTPGKRRVIKRETSSPFTPAKQRVEVVDLTFDSDEDQSDAWEDCETLEERLEEDHWWPRNCDVDPNIRESEG